MKAVRISLLTMVLLAGATPGSVPTADNNTLQGDTLAITKAGDGPCYWINGMWVCEP